MVTIFEKKILENAAIKNQAKWFYEILESYCYNKNYCFPGQKALAEKMNVSERTIQRYLNELKASGAVQVKKRGFNSKTEKNETNIYTLSFKKVGIAFNNAFKRSKNADTTKLSYKDNKVFIDDINQVVDLITSYTEKEGVEVINSAVEKIKNLLSKGNKITLKGFEIYFQKVIDTVKAAIKREKTYKETYIKKSKTSRFSSYELQRPFDESIEAKLLGWIPTEELSINDCDNNFMINQLAMLRG